MLCLSACDKDEGEAKGDDGEAKTEEVAEAEGETKAEPPPEPPPKAEGLGVLKVDAEVFAAGKDEVLFRVPKPQPGQETLGVVVSAHGETDGKVAIHNAATDTTGVCTSTLAALDDFELDLRARRADFVTVTTEPVDARHEDGTSIGLKPGVPITGIKPTRVLVHGSTLEVDVPTHKLGKFYEAAEPYPSEAKGKVADEGDPLHYDGGKTFEPGGLYRERGGLAHFGTEVESEEAEGDTVFVRLRGRCMEAVVLTTAARAEGPEGRYAMKGPEDAIPELAREFDPDMMERHAGILGELAEDEGHLLASPYGGALAVGGDDEDVWGGLTGTEVGEVYGVGSLGLVGSVRTTYTLAADTKLMWADGSPAGRVRTQHVFREAPTKEGTSSCWDVVVDPSTESKIRLCAAPGDVKEEEPDPYAALLGIGGSGGLGATGSGYGRGSGAGFGGRGKRVPRVRQAKADVTGDLDKDIIRRIVRAHINEVRYCYNQGLTKDPKLSGRVEIAFEIGGTGKVTSATVEDTTLSDKAVGTCVAKAVKRWKFPRPRDGKAVSVKYPFSLEPG
jgi:TonB family protein